MSEEIDAALLEQVIAASAEPTLVICVDHPDWPVTIANAAFSAAGGDDVLGRPVADVIESLCGRDTALDVSETMRSKDEASFPIELGGREFLLVLKPLGNGSGAGVAYYAAYCRRGDGATAGGDADMQHALLKAKRRIRDLSRDDPVTGLLNARAFRETFDHDWAVAAREGSSLALVVFALDDFEAYLDVFGRHAADSCLRRIGQAIRRSLRRASDVVARLEDERFVVLSHAADADGVRAFADRISVSVRELGLHHPRSSSARFVTVSSEVAVTEPRSDERGSAGYLEALLGGRVDGV